jgi:hypothetical protein
VVDPHERARIALRGFPFSLIVTSGRDGSGESGRSAARAPRGLQGRSRNEHLGSAPLFGSHVDEINGGLLVVV